MTAQKLSFISLVVLSCVMLFLNVALTVQNRKLKTEVAVPRALLPPVGALVQTLEGAGLDGSRISLSFAADSRKTLLFIFSTTCRVCDLNWPAWQSIRQSADTRQYRLAYVNIGSPISAAYLSQHDVSGGVIFAQLDPRAIVALNLSLTPLTVLLRSDGKVENVWPGLLEGDELTKVRSELATR